MLWPDLFLWVDCFFRLFKFYWISLGSLSTDQKLFLNTKDKSVNDQIEMCICFLPFIS